MPLNAYVCLVMLKLPAKIRLARTRARMAAFGVKSAPAAALSPQKRMLGRALFYAGASGALDNAFLGTDMALTPGGQN